MRNRTTARSRSTHTTALVPPVVVEEKGRKRGVASDQKRVAYTQHTDAYDAKNRFGMDEQIEMPSDPSQMWATLEAAIKAGRK